MVYGYFLLYRWTGGFTTLATIFQTGMVIAELLVGILLDSWII